MITDIDHINKKLKEHVFPAEKNIPFNNLDFDFENFITADELVFNVMIENIIESEEMLVAKTQEAIFNKIPIELENHIEVVKEMASLGLNYGFRATTFVILAGKALARHCFNLTCRAKCEIFLNDLNDRTIFRMTR